MKTTRIYKQLRKLSEGDSAVRELVILTERIFNDCSTVTKTVTNHMREYTLHDEVHLTSVVRLMDRLLPAPVLKRLQPLELASLIMSAALHDIGMAPPEDEVRSLLSAAEGEVGSEEQVRYASFRQAYGSLLRRQDRLRQDGRYAEAQEVEAYLLAEFLRQDHGTRSNDVIFSRYKDQLRYRDFAFAARMGQVCAGHTEDASVLEEIPCWELVAADGEYTNWRFIAVLLRLADILDFDPKRTPSVLFEHLGVRDPISVREWRKHRAITGWHIAPGTISFSAQCPDPVIEKTIRDFVSQMDQELLATRGTIASMHDKREAGVSERYDLALPPSIDSSDIRAVDGPDGPVYKYVDVAFYLDQDSIKSLIMGVRLYGNRLLFLRELLQNAVDACRHRAALHARRPELDKYKPSVTVRLFQSEGREFLQVEDNGMGMNEDIIRRYFARIGTSYYSSPSFLQERARLGLAFKPIAQFGIGVLSAFMAGDLLQVDTLRFGEAFQAVSVEIASEGSLFWFRRGARHLPGTCVTVRLSDPMRGLLGGFLSYDLVTLALLGGSPGPTGHHGSLPYVVSSLAPHIEFPLRVQDGKRVRLVREWWLDLRQSLDDYTEHAYTIELNLTADAPVGLDGRARVFMLGDRRTESVKFCRRQTIDGRNEHPSWDDIAHYAHNFREGRIDWVGHPDEEPEDRYRTVHWSHGRWAQQGFAVPTGLFEHRFPSYRDDEVDQPVAEFPLPIHYDVNLSGDFCLPLTADRKSVVSVEESLQVCRRISLSVSRLLLEALGSSAVRENRAFFEGVGAANKAFREALGTFLGD